jgi:hypothetical protein
MYQFRSSYPPLSYRICEIASHDKRITLEHQATCKCDRWAYDTPVIAYTARVFEDLRGLDPSNNLTTGVRWLTIFMLLMSAYLSSRRHSCPWHRGYGAHFDASARITFHSDLSIGRHATSATDAFIVHR